MTMLFLIMGTLCLLGGLASSSPKALLGAIVLLGLAGIVEIIELVKTRLSENK